MEGECLGDLVTCSYSRVDTQGAVPDSNIFLFHVITPLNNELTNILASSPQTDNAINGFKVCCWTPLLVYLPDIIARDQISILQAIK